MKMVFILFCCGIDSSSIKPYNYINVILFGITPTLKLFALVTTTGIQRKLCNSYQIYFTLMLILASQLGAWERTNNGIDPTI